MAVSRLLSLLRGPPAVGDRASAVRGSAPLQTIALLLAPAPVPRPLWRQSAVAVEAPADGPQAVPFEQLDVAAEFPAAGDERSSIWVIGMALLLVWGTTPSCPVLPRGGHRLGLSECEAGREATRRAEPDWSAALRPRSRTQQLGRRVSQRMRRSTRTTPDVARVTRRASSTSRGTRSDRPSTGPETTARPDLLRRGCWFGRPRGPLAERVLVRPASRALPRAALCCPRPP